MRLSVPALLALLVAPSAFAADPFVVRTVEVTDRKAVVATVEPLINSSLGLDRRHDRLPHNQGGRHGRRRRPDRPSD